MYFSFIILENYITASNFSILMLLAFTLSDMHKIVFRGIQSKPEHLPKSQNDCKLISYFCAGFTT